MPKGGRSNQCSGVLVDYENGMSPSIILSVSRNVSRNFLVNTSMYVECNSAIIFGTICCDTNFELFLA